MGKAANKLQLGSNSTHPQTQPDESKRSPKWSRDELILALQLYLTSRQKPLAKNAPEIIELSETLNRLGRALGHRYASTYRNSNGVYMKLMNFRSHDPTYTSTGRKGLISGGKDEAVVWRIFSDDLTRLALTAEVIRRQIDIYAHTGDLAGAEDTGICEAEEGQILTRVHRIRERDRRLMESAKNQARQKHGRLVCEACNFDFLEKYGSAGDDIIDVHHTKPLHAMKPGDITRIEDLALLCCNCHRVVHSRKKWLSIDEVRALLLPQSESKQGW